MAVNSIEIAGTIGNVRITHHAEDARIATAFCVKNRNCCGNLIECSGAPRAAAYVTRRATAKAAAAAVKPMVVVVKALRHGRSEMRRPLK